MSTRLPIPLTRFVGREAELAEVIALLTQARLLTLTGSGGGGKTRLALRLASELTDQFAGEVWFVDLSSLTGGGFVWDRVATTLGVKEPGADRRWAEAISRHLGARRTLLVLDNCEHIVEEAASAAGDLLESSLTLKVVATSREPLGVAGEVTWVVPPLIEADAVELFSDRARQAWPQFRLSDRYTEPVLDICRRLDGIPLAIELAAARTRALDPADIAAGLKDRFAVLPGGPRTAPRRQATLEASFDWSYELLSDPERALLRQLSVFAGGFELQAALAVCPRASLELLAALTDRSLVVIEGRSDQGGPRYRMLETVRQFAAEHLDEADEVELIRTRHRDYYLGLAETVGPNVLGPDDEQWRARLHREQDNMRAALAWSQGTGDAQALARMVVALTPFAEAEMWLEQAEERAADLPPLLRAQLRNVRCFFAVSKGHRLSEVPGWANEALAMARAAGDKREEAFALSLLGLMEGLAGGARAMRPYFEEARSLAPLTSSVTAGRLLMFTYLTSGIFLLFRLFQSDSEELRRLAEEAIDRAQAGGHSFWLHEAMWAAGTVAFIQGRLADADRLLKTALAEGRQTNESLIWKCLFGIAWVSMLRGDLAAARAAVDECLSAVLTSEAPGGSGTLVEPVSKWIVGWLELAGGDPAGAKDTLPAAVEFIRSSQLSRFAALPLTVLAQAQLALRDLDNAQASLDEATDLARSGELTWVQGRASLVRAKLRACQGGLREAEALAHEAIRLAREAGDQLGVADALELLARLAAEQDSYTEAIRLSASVESLRTTLGYRLAIDRDADEAALTRARQRLGQVAFEAAWTEGAELSADEAIAYAARGRGARRRPTAGWASLTPSEVEVVRLVARHLSNPDIAARLFISPATVKTHLIHIFAKLGVDSRSELAAEALRHGIQVHASSTRARAVSIPPTRAQPR